ncbi:2-dehydropantoate 2-reductase-like protein [Boeremia exigua]|uniref:2-dehydropantoate 2-reductase-like protein n=1 Tax=Boeremia exigua TaxID=749465 RepID=UPI001E8DD95B|nr:2-dehydropantoate 2-reductase-like protein [Boeremia exigua]KAH6639110.1 2-dehydropantoate 2-reductase-like protein [Boeremia exigua]
MVHVQKPLDILIFGTGAVGSTIGWRLAQYPGARLSVVCRSNYDAVKQHGIQLKTKMWGNGVFKPYRVARSTHEISDMSFDYVVCANKVTGSEGMAFARDLAHVVSSRTTLVSAQNGVGVEAPLRQAFRDNTILSAVCYISCLQPFPGVVEQVSNLREHAFHIGSYHTSGNFRPAVEEQRLRTFACLDDKFKEIEDVGAERWTKQIFNGAWNPMTAISGLDTHALLATPYVETVLEIAKETFNVAVKMGTSLPSDLPARTIETARTSPSLAPSMLQDFRNKRSMEVESLCGNVVRNADRLQVAVPTLRMVYHTLLEMNRQIQGITQPLHIPRERLAHPEVGVFQALTT